MTLLTGCGDGKIARYPVTGTVLVDGQPYEGAKVMFVPVGGDEAFQRERPMGVTDATGKFELTTFLKGDGSPKGDFRVMVRETKPKNAEQARAWGNRPSIPRKYNKPGTSGLTATIAENQTELPPFELEGEKRRGRR